MRMEKVAIKPQLLRSINTRLEWGAKDEPKELQLVLLVK